jgi:hypothetical protein
MWLYYVWITPLIQVRNKTESDWHLYTYMYDYIDTKDIHAYI